METRAIRGHGVIFDAGNAREFLYQLDDASPDEGLSAGDAYLVDAQFNRAFGEAIELLEGQYRFMGTEEVQVRCRKVEVISVSEV